MRYRPLRIGDIYASFEGFEQWREDSRAKTAALCEWYRNNHEGSGAIDRAHYAKLKKYLSSYFAGNCAYCERNFDAVAFGDVEHYRPKLAVTEDPGHRGYYWLAYDVSNLLPSCERCNRGSGKRNFFPVAGPRAVAPGDSLDAELPLLLNPWHEADCGPEAGHLGYESEIIDDDLVFNGCVVGVTDRGKQSIQIYDLNRPPLTRTRARAQADGLRAFQLEWRSPQGRKDWAAEWLSGDREHSSAVRAAAAGWWEFASADVARLFGDR